MAVKWYVYRQGKSKWELFEHSAWTEVIYAQSRIGMRPKCSFFVTSISGNCAKMVEIRINFATMRTYCCDPNCSTTHADLTDDHGMFYFKREDN